LHPYH
jgi:hypothetical protein